MYIVWVCGLRMSHVSRCAVRTDVREETRETDSRKLHLFPKLLSCSFEGWMHFRHFVSMMSLHEENQKMQSQEFRNLRRCAAENKKLRSRLASGFTLLHFYLFPFYLKHIRRQETTFFPLTYLSTQSLRSTLDSLELVTMTTMTNTENLYLFDV